MPQPISEEELSTITKKVYALYAKHGFDGISMDEVSRQAKISKATFYHYFTSKEDLIRGMVRFLISHLDSVKFTAAEEIGDVVKCLQEFYVKSVLFEALSGMQFLNDLKRRYPDSYRDCRDAMDAMQERFSEFYFQAVKKGFFRDLPFSLVIRQFSSMMPAVTGMDYLEENRLTLPEALRSYYRMFLTQILAGPYLFIADEEETYDFAEDLAEELREDFYIDTIRR